MKALNFELAAKKTSQSPKKKKGPMDLDTTTEEEEENEDVTGLQRKYLDRLERELRNCRKCGNGKICKIDNEGRHVEVTSRQLKSWSDALVCSPLHFKSDTHFAIFLGCKHKRCNNWHTSQLSTVCNVSEQNGRHLIQEVSHSSYSIFEPTYELRHFQSLSDDRNVPE